MVWWAPGMADLDKELADIRREVIESRTLVIRADNQLKTLHAEVKGLGRRLEEMKAQQRLASAAAYGLFALLAVGGGLAVAAVGGAVGAHERERLSHELAESTAALEQAKAQAATAAAASLRAADVYRMLGEGSSEDRLKGVPALARVDVAHLTPLERRALEERVETARREIGVAALEHARLASRRGEPAAAADELTRFLTLDPPEPQALEASFLLGVALARSGRPAESIPLLSRVVDKDTRGKNREEAMALLALAYEQTGKPEGAAALARTALEANPTSPWAPAFRSRLAAARRALAADAGVPSATSTPPVAARPTAAGLDAGR
jgi:tetratricopeptide (TPR) repeat protein